MYYCREASEQDIPSMVLLLKQLMEIEVDFQFNAEAQYDGLELLIEAAQSLVVVAVNNENDRIIGMCTGQVMISTAEGGYSLLIDDVVVNEKYRGNGIGTGMLHYLEKKATEKFGIKRMQLCADNVNALKFYEKEEWIKTKFILLKKMVD